MASFGEFLDALTGELKTFIGTNFKTFSTSATKDANAFIKKSREDLQRWTKLLADGSLTLHDFEFLLAAKKDLAEMTALKQAGLAQVQLDRFINGVVGVIINTATKVFL